MDMPQPNENHKKLARLAGHWSGEEKMFPSQWDPEGDLTDPEIIRTRMENSPDGEEWTPMMEGRFSAG